MLGTWRLGAITAHISTLVADELAAYVTDCTPKVLVYTHELRPAIERDRERMSSVTTYTCMDGPQDGALGWSELLDGAGSFPARRPDGADPAHLSYTSGSTGRPKGAVLRHAPTLLAARVIAERLELTRADISLGPTSLASSYHLVVNLLPGMHRGMTVGLRSRWDAHTVRDLIEERGVTYLPANPFLLDDLLQACREHGVPASLRVVVTGGAPVPPELKRAYVEELGIAFCESYGQSELGGFVALGSPSRQPARGVGAGSPADDDRYRAIGPVLPDRDVMIMDAEGREAAPGSPGEVVVRSGVMWGYWGRPEATAAAVVDGWLHTGDTGRIDRDGVLTLLGRWSERIEVDGEVLFPRPFEEALLRNGDVERAAVIGLPSADGTAAPVAYVELRGSAVGGADDADRVLAWYRGQAELDQRLAGVRIVDVMPMTPTGKLDKVALRAAACA